MNCLDDATVLGLVEGRLAPEIIARVDEHIDTCASCREVVTHVASTRSSARVLARGDTVGRYVVGDLLGAGAMGRVYSAWEPELDRRVAIKVLREADGRERLVREAQAMARLNHPNVVTVHEVGSTDDGVFVAMELVDGETLRAWARTPKPWRHVTHVLIEVARGLAAVHAAGVIHRDVKPDNVIVGADERVRLGDFGLARSGGGATAPMQASFALGTQSTGSAVAGTPVYMAPELLRGGAADAASDQFSFGVMAYELLAGRRPFEGQTWTELLKAIEAQDVRPLRDVPGWLDDVVRRCLAREPARRFGSMREIAELLARKLAGRSPTRWIAGALAAALLASGVTWMAVRDDGQITAACAIGQPRASLTWNAQVRAQLSARGATPAALGLIDRWMQSWVAERDATCRSARFEPVARIASRERCLEQRHAEVSALLQRADASPDRILDAFAALPDASECRSADADPLPADPVRAAAAREVLAELPTLRAAIALDERGTSTRAEQLVARARVSAHAPTLADTLLVLADASRASDRMTDAARHARDAAAAAERGHADLLRARAWLARVAIAGEQRDLAAADDLAAIAQGAIERIGSPHLAASLARIRGLVAYYRGQLDEARTLLLDARDRWVALAGERTLDIAAVDSALGSVARAAGDLDAAERYHRSVLALDRELRGPNHRDVARDLHNIAGVLRLRGDLDGALRTYREALAAEIATLGERSIAAALTNNSIGLVELARNDLAAAEARFELARDVFRATNHGDLAFSEHNLGLVAQARGDHLAALARFNAAAAVYDKTIGAGALAPIRLELDRARSELALGRRAAARAQATRARDRARAADIAWIADEASALLDTLVPSTAKALPDGVARAAQKPAFPSAGAPALAPPTTDVRTTDAPTRAPAADAPTCPPAADAPTSAPATADAPDSARPTASGSKPVPPKPQPKRDVGVYGSAPSW